MDIADPEHSELNLPDLKFYSRCYELYQILRGVFNTIDNWFFEYGVVDVLNRRFYILTFLEFISKNIPAAETQKFIKFGHGGLAIKLKEFIKNM
ncbi:hypothetical protein AB1K84_23420 [Mesobacillus foraminis]|uniref:hypothetical protein n=1 Tax=Mesobacillus foraminis TaxID=279826 RepID=UPI0039A296B2